MSIQTRVTNELNELLGKARSGMYGRDDDFDLDAFLSDLDEVAASLDDER